MYKHNNQDNHGKTPHIEKTPWQLAQEKKQQEEYDKEKSMAKHSKIKKKKTISHNLHFKKKEKTPLEKTELESLKRRFIILFIILLMWSIYFISPLAKVKEYQFVGTWQVEPLEILQDGGMDNHQSVWSILAKEERINQSVKERIPKVSSLEVSLRLPNTIVVTVLENPAIAHYLSNEKHYELLADGRSIEVPLEQMDVPYPLLVAFSEKDLEKIAVQFKNLPASLLADIKKIELVNQPGIKNRLLMEMKDGTPVIGNLNTIGSKIIYYPRIKQEVGSRKGTIDMEVGVFFTPDIQK